MASDKNYRGSLRSVIRGLWSGILTRSQAKSAFESSIERWITIAWEQGATECGIGPDELTQDELIERDEFIGEQIDQSNDFINHIVENSKKNKGKLTPLFKRAELWVNQFNSASTLAESMACADEKRIWVLGRVEKHCRSCLKLAEKVKRLSFWQNHVLPRNAPNQQLECGGFRCDCDLRKTSKPISKGPLPRLP